MGLGGRGRKQRKNKKKNMAGGQWECPVNYRNTYHRGQVLPLRDRWQSGRNATEVCAALWGWVSSLPLPKTLPWCLEEGFCFLHKGRPGTGIWKLQVSSSSLRPSWTVGPQSCVHSTVPFLSRISQPQPYWHFNKIILCCEELSCALLDSWQWALPLPTRCQ